MMQHLRATSSKVLGHLLVLVAWLAISTTSAYAQNTVTKVTLVITDAQGNVLMTTDSHGNVLARYTYRPYGTQQSGPTNAGPGYTGHVNDPATGLVYMQQRYYDPAVGRFISPDSVAPTPGDLFNFGRYTYANDNPIVNIDPDGRQEVPEDPDEERRIEDELHPKLGRNWADPNLPIVQLPGESRENFLQRRAVAWAKDDSTPAEFKKEIKQGIKPVGSQIDRKTFAKERARFWKQEAKSNASSYSGSDLGRMEKGKAPIGSDGHPMELHHVDGTMNGGTKPMTRSEHRRGDNYKKNHPWLFNNGGE